MSTKSCLVQANALGDIYSFNCIPKIRTFAKITVLLTYLSIYMLFAEGSQRITFKGFVTSYYIMFSTNHREAGEFKHGHIEKKRYFLFKK